MGAAPRTKVGNVMGMLVTLKKTVEAKALSPGSSDQEAETIAPKEPYYSLKESE